MRSGNSRVPVQKLVWRAGIGLFGVALGLAACVDSGGGDTGIVYPTLIAVAPEDFLGRNVRCTNAPGGLRRYVATLYDVTVEGEGFALPSSGPVDCLLEVKFGFASNKLGPVVPGHRYVARVDGYDRTDIRPLGPPDVANSGSPVMVDATTGEYVPPRWTSTCSGAPERRADSAPPVDGEAADANIPDSDIPDGEGSDSGSADADAPEASPEAAAQVSCAEDPDPIARRDTAVTCARYLTRRVAACSPLCDRVGPGLTGLSVSIDRALDTLKCGNGPGQVATFRVEREGGSEPAQSAECGQAVIFTEGIAPGQFTRFKVTAFEAGKTSPSWETQCGDRPTAGTVLPVSCDPLVSTGTGPKTDL
jgi:hypothetical protein